MNTSPFPSFNVSAPPMPAGFPAAAAPVQPDYAAQARNLIREKVLIDSKPITTEQMIVWAYTEISKRMGGGLNIDKRMCEGLSSAPNASINLGNDNEEQLTVEQCQAKITELIPTKLTWKGAVCTGTQEYFGQVLNWLWGNIPAVSSLSDNHQKALALLNWIRNLPGVYELDDATRAALVQHAPPNPISDQKTTQIAQPPAAIVPPVEEPNNEPDAPLFDPVDGQKCKNLRGLKTRVTRTHKTDWGPFCQQYGLDPLTGLKTGAPAAVGGPVAPTTPPPASAPLPALVGMGAPVGTPAVPQLPPASTGIVSPPVVPTHNPPALYDANGQPTPAYAAAMAAANGNQAMPVPPVSQPTSPVSFAPSFSTPAAAVPPAVMTQAPPAVAAVGFQSQAPIQVPASLVPQVQVPPSTGWAPPQAASAVPVGMNRAQMAQMLGGPVNLIIVRLLEINSVNLANCTDVNQLVELAKKMARDELKIADLAEAAYAKGSQTAQRHFADLLTKYPNCYLLMNGFEFIIPDGFLEIVIARTVFVYHVSDRGGNVEIKF